MQQDTPERNELDVRVIEPRFKHATIHERLYGLEAGQALVIVNDHDPRPLRFEIEADHPGQYSWTYLQQGPEVWRVKIKRT